MDWLVMTLAHQNRIQNAQCCVSENFASPSYSSNCNFHSGGARIIKYCVIRITSLYQCYSQ